MQENPVELAVAVAFLTRAGQDRDSGRLRTLADYQSEFPGFEHVVAREYASLTSVDAPPSSPRAPSAAPEPRRIGDYRIERELGRGGQGTVFLAVDERLGRRVALKTLSAAWAASPEALLRFAKEARVLASLDHPGICAVYEASSVDGAPFIAMRYVAGEPLTARAARRAGPATAADIAVDLAVVERLARAVHAAHEAGVVHRDLKPANVLVDPEGLPVVLDFGLAHAVDQDGAAGLTATGEVLGTPAYMAPEQAAGDARAVDRRTDVHALGVLLFELVAGRRPYDGATRVALLEAVRTAPPPDLRKASPAATEDLRTVVAKALAKAPADRYATALELADDLRRVRLFEPVAARPISAAGRLVRWARRRPTAAALWGVLALGVPTLGALGGWYFTNRPLVEARRIGEAVERELAAGFATLLDQYKPDPAAATAAFERAAALRPDSVEAACGAAFARLRSKDPAAALRGLDAHRAAFGVRPAVERLRADALAQLGRAAEAQAVLAALPPAVEAVDCFIEGVRAARLGEAAAHQGAEERAVEWFEAAIQRSPVRRVMYVEQLAKAVGRTKLAGPASRAAATARLVLGGWRGEAAAAWAMIGSDPAAAVAAFERAAALEPSFVVETGLGAVFLEAGRHEEAARILKAAALRRGDDATAFLNWAIVEMERGEFATALDAAQRAAALRPDVADMHYAAARCLRRLGREPEALETLRRAVAAEPSNAVVRAELGRSLMRLKDYPAAIVEARRATELDAKFPHAWLILGEAAALAEDEETAIKSYREALRVDPQPQYALWAARALLPLDRDEEIAAFLNECEKLAGERGASDKFRPYLERTRAEAGLAAPASRPADG